VAHGQRKEPLDFGGNPNHAMLELGSSLWLDGGCMIHDTADGTESYAVTIGIFTRHLFN